MKTRNCLVSNSSTSNFILIGILVDPKGLTKEDLTTSVWVTGLNFCDGVDIFQIKEEGQLKFIQENTEHFNVYNHAHAEVGFSKIQQMNIHRDKNVLGLMVVVGGQCTINNSSNTEKLIENYLPDYELRIEQEANKLMQEVKETAKKRLLKRYGVE